MPSTSDVANAGNIELQESMENASRSMENLTEPLEDESSEDLPMHELLDLDKQLRSFRGSLKVKVAKKVQLEQCIEKEKCNLEKSETIQNMTMGFEKTLGIELQS